MCIMYQCTPAPGHSHLHVLKVERGNIEVMLTFYDDTALEGQLLFRAACTPESGLQGPHM